MLGDPAVGKTTLVARFVHKIYRPSYKQTMGLDLTLKKIAYKGEIFRIQLWDLASQKAFAPMRKRFYTGAVGALCVYDLTRRQTLVNLGTWLNEMQEIAGDVVFVVLGNKSDLSGPYREIGDEEGKKWAKETGSVFWGETSAKTGENVEESFMSLIEHVMNSLTNK